MSATRAQQLQVEKLDALRERHRRQKAQQKVRSQAARGISGEKLTCFLVMIAAAVRAHIRLGSTHPLGHLQPHEGIHCGEHHWRVGHILRWCCSVLHTIYECRWPRPAFATCWLLRSMPRSPSAKWLAKAVACGVRKTQLGWMHVGLNFEAGVWTGGHTCDFVC